MAQNVTPWQINFGFKAFYRCDVCYRNVIENYQWLGFGVLPAKTQQNKSECPYCKAEIEFDLTSIDAPTPETPAVKKFATGDEAFVFKTDQSVLTTVNLTLRGTGGKIVTVYWGDSNIDYITMTGANVLTTHDYTDTGDYYIRLFCEDNILLNIQIQSSKLAGTIPSFSKQTNLWYLYLNANLFTSTIPPLSLNSGLRYIYLQGNSLSGSFPSISTLVLLQRLYLYTNSFTGNLPDPSNCPALRYYLANNNSFSGSIPSFSTNGVLTYLYLHTNSLTGTIPSFSNNTIIQRIYLQGNNLSGTTPSLTNNTSLIYFRVQANAITGYTASTLSLTLIFFSLSSNLLPSAAVNQILADFVVGLAGRPINGIIYLHGTGNQPPTGQGLIDKAAIIAHGWTVLTN